jgi:hypothetical protein
VKTTENPHKGLAAMYKVKQAFLTDEELIQVCHNSRADEHLEVKRTEDLIQRSTISATLEIESLSTSDAIHVTETRFREIKDMMSNTTRHTECAMKSVTMNFITKLLTSKNSA